MELNDIFEVSMALFKKHEEENNAARTSLKEFSDFVKGKVFQVYCENNVLQVQFQTAGHITLAFRRINDNIPQDSRLEWIINRHEIEAHFVRCEDAYSAFIYKIMVLSREDDSMRMGGRRASF